MVVMLLLLSVSCGGDKKEVVAVAFDPESTFTMRTTDIVSLISDSGVTRYRVTSPEMMVFDKSDEPYWYFPQGVYFEKFDSLFTTEASVEADTAYHWYDKKLWKLIGNVEVRNLQGDRFETDTLYWNQETERVYSEAFMRITRADQILTGIGFESDQNMTKYRIYRPQGSFPVEEETTADNAVEATTTEETSMPVELPAVRRERPQRRVVPPSAAKDTTALSDAEELPEEQVESPSNETTENTSEETIVNTSEEEVDVPPTE